MLRPAATSDAEAIAQIHVKAWQSAYLGIVPDEVLANLSVEKRAQRFREILSDPNTRSETWVYEDDGSVLGWCTVGPNRDELGPEVGELWAIYVLPEAQRKGIGSALIENARQVLREKGYGTAILWMLTENEAARKFYEARGWAFDGITQLEPTAGVELDHSRFRCQL